MIHDEDKHHLLAPQDIPGHLQVDHGVETVVDEHMTVWSRNYLDHRGIPIEGDARIDNAHAWHEWVHSLEERESSDHDR